MKKIIASMIVLATISACLLVQAEPPTDKEPYVRLPTDYVTMKAEYGSISWFEMTLSKVSDGFDIQNGEYQGWCIEKDIFMTRGVNHQVVLYSCLDSKLPETFQDDDWDKVNYIINHKNGSRDSIQDTIWYYICEDSLPEDTDAQSMIEEADENGEGFIPKPGENIAIIVEGVSTIQGSFLELPLRFYDPIGDLVWNDINANGIQDKGEPGLINVNVELYDEENSLISSTKTDMRGYYSFKDPPSSCYIKFKLPTNYRFSPKDAGSNDNFDSDADRNTGKTILINIQAEDTDLSWDAGMYYKKDGTEPSEPVEPTPQVNNNPTADATFGEPYSCVIGEKILFDGSRSYDRDGNIVSYEWDFGDGSNGSGVIVNHTYTEIDHYTVQLTVEDDDGATDTYTTEAIVHVGNHSPANLKIDGPIFGHKNTSYTYTAVATDPDDDEIQYTFKWGDAIKSQTTSDFMASDTPFSANNSWSKPGRYVVQVTAYDNISAVTSAYKIIFIDAVDVLDFGYMTDDDGDEIYDTFYNEILNKSIEVESLDDDVYLIDLDGDDIWDYEYITSTGNLMDYNPSSEVEEQLDYMFVVIPVLIIFIIIVIVIVSQQKKAKK